MVNRMLCFAHFQRKTSAASPNTNVGYSALKFSLLHPQREEERAGERRAVEEAGRAEDLQEPEQQPRHSDIREQQQ